MLNAIMLSIVHGECRQQVHYAECRQQVHYTECRYAECRGPLSFKFLFP